MPFKWSLFKDAASQWSEHNAPRLGAALAYYTVLSLAPLLLVIVAVAGWCFGGADVSEKVYGQIQGVVGSQAATVIQSLLKDAHKPASGILATVGGFLILLVSASGVFIELHDMLNYIWEAPKHTGGGIWEMIRLRFFSFAMVLGIGFLLMVSLVLSAAIVAVGTYASQFISMPAPMLEGLNFVLTFVATTILFALIYKVIPEVPVEWSDVWIGAVVTSLMFAIGKFAIGMYLGKASVGSAYGAAGSLIVLLVWVYYSSQIFLFGAEFTHVYAKYRDSNPHPVRA